MYKKYLRKFVALSVCLLLGLSVTDVGFSSWETLVGSAGGSVSADMETGAEVVITDARLVLEGNANLASGDITGTEDSDSSDEACAEQDSAAEETESSDGTSGDAEASDDGGSGYGETDSGTDETKGYDDASDGANSEDEDEDETSDSRTATDGDEEVSSDSETSSMAGVTAVGRILTGAAAESDAESAESAESAEDAESAENEDSSSEATIVELDADEIAGTAPDFPGVILPDAESAVTYIITVENQGRYDAVVGDVTLPDGFEDFEVDGPEIGEGRVLEPGESLELVWTVCLADGGAAEIDFSVEIDFDLPDAGEAPEACYEIIKAGEEEEE